MLTFDQIKELIELVASHRMSGLELERSGFRLKVEGHKVTETVHLTSPPAAAPAAAPVLSVPASAPAQPAPASAPAQDEAAAAEAAADDTPPDAHVITSPIVGTFYRAPNPEAPAFVEVGDVVKRGQVLCIVEAMKLMNEIESEVAGEIVKIYPESSQPVEFGEPLFAIRT